MSAGQRVWRVVGGDVHLTVRLTPKSSRDAVDGFDPKAAGDAAVLKVRVRAVPEDGAANTAVCAVIAKWLGVPKNSVSLASGAKSRNKTLRISAADAGLEQRLTDRLAALEPGQTTET